MDSPNPGGQGQLALVVQVRKIVDESFPGWVECSFVDARGTEHLVVEKIPVVCEEQIDASTPLPRWGFVACLEVGRRDDSERTIVSIDIGRPWGIASTSGAIRFDVTADQLTFLR